jgi:Gpi18-like mannosyltransferase
VKENIKKILLASLFSLVPTMLIWLPFFFRVPVFWGIPLPTNGLATIVSNYDGPLYLVVAKTLYNKVAISTNFQFPLTTEYYTAHFPLFPLVIKLIGIITNYPYAMLIATLITGVLAIYFFHKLISDYVDKKNALYLTFLFAIFPARWLIVRSTGSADPLFVGTIIASIYYFKHKKYWLAGIWGLVAQLTKSPGILLFISYSIYFLTRTDLVKNWWLNVKKVFPVLLIPLGLLAVFGLYYLTQGSFWTYFHSGDNIHLFFPPFQIFNYSAPWVGTFWLEEVIFIYLIGAIGVYKLYSKKEYEIAVFSSVFYILSLFIAHRDLMRYILPLVPFLYIAFSDVLTKKEFKIASVVIIIPIYLFSLAFISQNVMPISNWAPFL